MKTPELIVADLDGTLVDSAPDIAYALSNMLRELGRKQVSLEQVRNWIGDGISALVKRALRGSGPGPEDSGEFDRAMQIYSNYYGKNISQHSRIYPGVIDGLRQFRDQGIVLAVITNKHSRFTGLLLEKMALSKYFDAVISGDTYSERKPHPLPLLKTAEQFNIEPCNALMVGDSINDINAARAAGFVSVCVPYGYRGGSAVEDLKADLVVETIDRLPELFCSTG